MTENDPRPDKLVGQSPAVPPPALPQAVYPQNARVAQFWTSVEQRMATIPGVESATVMTAVVGISSTDGIVPEIPGRGRARLINPLKPIAVGQP